MKQATETFHNLLVPCSPCPSLAFFGPPWASLGLSSWADLGIHGLLLGFSGPLFASLAFSGQSPKQPTHTHKKHTETFHKLPTTRLHPERETIKKQTQTMKQATETFHNLLFPRSPCPSLVLLGPLWASLGLSGLIRLSPAFSGLLRASLGTE